ncbi:DNA-directed RNA polymerase III subunit rpc25, partial [Cladochytrium tenue]
MFFLVTQSSKVRVHPRQLSKPRAAAVADELNRKYANRILHNVGLCIRVFDILDVGDGLVHACLDGSYMTDVKFRMIVFRPFVGEILTGKVASSSVEGLRVSLDFFDDIIIPQPAMKPGCYFDKSTGAWVWPYTDDDTGDVTPLEIAKGEAIRFRVEGETFVDVPPPSLAAAAATAAAAGQPAAGAGAASAAAAAAAQPQPPPPQPLAPGDDVDVAPYSIT